jgi:adenylate cyclase
MEPSPPRRTPAWKRILPRISAFRLALWVGLLVALVHALETLGPSARAELPVVSRLEHAVQDFALTRLRGERAPSGEVVIVAVDERAVQTEGRWPWSRAKMARLVDRLAQGGVRAVGFDMIWADDDEQGRRIAEVVSLLENARPAIRDPAAAAQVDRALAVARGKEARALAALDPTEQLAAAIERAHNVSLGFLFSTEPGADGGEGAEAVSRLAFFRTEPVQVPDRLGRLAPALLGAGAPSPMVGLRFPSVEAPRDALLAVADSGGFFNVLPDRDGVIRRYPLLAQAGGAIFPSLGVAVLAKALGKEGVPAPVVPVAAAGGARLMAVKVGPLLLETDGAGRVQLDQPCSYRRFPTWSAADVLAGRLPADATRGKIALVGTTAPGTWDQRVTSVDDAAPGVITHATFVENALRGELLRRTPGVQLLEVLLLLALAVGLALLFARAGAAVALPVLLAALIGWEAFAWVALIRLRVLLVMGLPAIQMIAMFLAATSFRVVSEERQKRRARELFGRFLAPAMVEQVLARRDALRLGGEKRELTVLFSDIRGFTTLSEQLDPRVLLELLNEYLSPMTDIVVSDHGGTLDKYIGDAIMAFWGAPHPAPDHPLLACRAALAMTERLQALRPGWVQRGLPAIDVGIGINTGPMSVGFVGSQDRFYNYTVLGDAVNLASRLEGLNRAYGTRILISGSTWQCVKHAMVARELDAVRVKGKREPVRVYELLGQVDHHSAPDGQSPWLQEFDWGLVAYKAQRWEEATAHFGAADALASGGDPCSKVYLARCQSMRHNPPSPQWDGVYEMKSK